MVDLSPELSWMEPPAPSSTRSGQVAPGSAIQADKAASPTDDGIHEELPASAQNGRPGSERTAAPEVEVPLLPGRRPRCRHRWALLAMAEEAPRPTAGCRSPCRLPPGRWWCDATRDHREVEVDVARRCQATYFEVATPPRARLLGHQSE
ncbi:hypothetical protein ZWY2020_055701 [Hordeum vulgare]|nr:hypothetical protein ZWY2020_055701 [Hordeum vulgare]